MTEDHTILVVDDESAVRMLVKRILGEQGYHILEAGSGEHALQILKDSGDSINLLFTDLKMPGMHGTELAREARAMFPDLPILFMSGYSSESASVPESDFVEKPFNRPVLLVKVKRALGVLPAPQPSNQYREPQDDDITTRLMRAEWTMARRKVQSHQ